MSTVPIGSPATAGPGISAVSDTLLAEDPWVWWRSQMPVAQQYAYFDHAAVGPLSGPAGAAIANFSAQATTAGDLHWPDWAARLEDLRRSTAAMLSCDVSEICLVPNTTSGINLVAEGWPWSPGDSVVVPEGEFPSNLFPWQNQQSRGVQLRIVSRRDDEISVDDLIDQVDDSTRIIAVSWVGYASGFRVDVERLVAEAHSRGVAVFLDAIQGLGVFPLDLSKVPVDFLAADGHKWLLGPEGAGVAMIRREHLDRLRCGNVGWGSVKNSYDYAAPQFNLKSTASRYESGSANMIGNAALAASMDLMMNVRRIHGDDSIGNRVVELAQQLDRDLQQLGAKTRLPVRTENRSGILTFEVPGVEPSNIRKRAIEQKVVLSCRDGGVRASIHAYNNEHDLSRLVDVIRSFV